MSRLRLVVDARTAGAAFAACSPCKDARGSSSHARLASPHHPLQWQMEKKGRRWLDYERPLYWLGKEGGGVSRSMEMMEKNGKDLGLLRSPSIPNSTEEAELAGRLM